LCGEFLLVFRRLLLVRLASVALPKVLKLTIQDLCSSLLGQSRLFKAQFTHLHVVDPGNKKDGGAVWVELQLTHNPLTVKVGQPPSLLLVQALLPRRIRFDKRNSEVPLLVLRDSLG
jgi:hypothetical protein